MELSTVGTLFAIAVSVSALGGLPFAYGKVVQKVKDNQEANNERFLFQGKKFEENSRMHEDHYRLAREHDEKDRNHFLDTTVHWTANERQWMLRRFDDLKERFDELRAMNERQEQLLKELLLRGKNPN